MGRAAGHNGWKWGVVGNRRLRLYCVLEATCVEALGLELSLELG